MMSRTNRLSVIGGLLAVLLLAAAPVGAQQPAPATEDGSVAEVGAKLSNPVSDVWALFTEFDLSFSDGDLARGDHELGSTMIFQPIMPFPLYGPKEKRWQLITRPTIPVVWTTPVPTGFNDFDRKTGLADILLPLLVSPPSGNWLLGLGPDVLFPTSTSDALGRQQWGMGVAGLAGYKTKKWVMGVFPQYYWGIGSRGDQGSKPDASFMNLLYFGFLNLPDAWQVGFNPTITYDHKAASGNKWNVPVGLVVTKTTKIAGRPVKFQLGAEYSVVSQDAFGKRALFKLNIIPVIPTLVKNPIFGGS